MLPADVSWLPPRQYLEVEKCNLFKNFFSGERSNSHFDQLPLWDKKQGWRQKWKAERGFETLSVSRKRKVCVRSRDFAISVKFVILILNHLCSMKPSAFLRDCHKYKYFVSCYTFTSYNEGTISTWHDLSKDVWVCSKHSRKKRILQFPWAVIL